MVQVSAQELTRKAKRKSRMDSVEGIHVASLVAESLRKRTKSFSTNFELCRQKYSEKSIHDLRVSLRRINSILTILDEVFEFPRARKLKKRLSKLLKSFSELRDLQVQILSVSALLPHFSKLEKFQNHLLIRERKMIRNISKVLRKSKIEIELKGLKSFCTTLEKLPGDLSEQKRLKAQLFNHVESRFAKVLVLNQLVDPTKIETIHRVRLGFKKFRYSVEALSTLFPTAKTKVEEMHDFQNIMGDIHDLDVLQMMLNTFLEENSRQSKFMGPVLEKIAIAEKKQIQRFMRQAANLDKFRIVL